MKSLETAATRTAGSAGRDLVDPAGDCDLAVIGAGIVGLAAAREMCLRHPDLRIVVLEREARLAAHQTAASSGVVHAGIYYTPGSLKARLCRQGAEQLASYCERHGLAYERCGKVIVALRPGEVAGLDELYRRGRANGVAGLARLDAGQLREIEPHAAGIAALHCPCTAIVDFAAVAVCMAGDLERRGGVVATSCEVSEIAPARSRRTVISHARGQTSARRVLVCAGAWSDRLAVGAGASTDPRIVPFRGAYLRLAPRARHLVRGLIYPVPDPALPFLGVHLTRRMDGEVLLGPTALLAGALDAYRVGRVRARDLKLTLSWPGTWRMMARHWRTGVAELHMAIRQEALVRACARYVPALTGDDVLPGPAGVRAQAIGRDGTLIDDFVFDELDGVVYVRNAPSPAATSSLAIASMIADILQAEMA